MVSPAEAATMYRHPNLQAWRSMLARHTEGDGQRLFCVFITSLDDPVSSRYDEVLRRQIAEGEHAELYA